jgi:hypothetical protein
VIGSSDHRVIGKSKAFGFQVFNGPITRSLYSPAGTRFNAFFTVPRSIMIFSCSSVIA